MLHKIAGIYEKEAKFSEAIDTYNEIIGYNSHNVLAKNNLASLLLDHGSEPDADTTKALELVKGFESIRKPAIQDTLGWTYFKSGNHEKAVEVLSKVVEDIKTVAVFQYHLGKVLFDNGQKNKAKPYLEMSANSDQSFFGKDDAKKILSDY